METTLNRRPNGQAGKEPAPNFVTDEDRAYARSIIGDLAAELFGKPSRHTNTELRFFDDGKLVVNIDGHREGTWKLFNDEVSFSRDAFGLVQYGTGCDFPAAAAYILGDRRAAPARQVNSKAKTKAADDWLQIIPPPPDAARFDPQAVVWSGHKLAGVWSYNAADGSPLFHVVRLEAEEIDPETGEVKVSKKTPVATFGRYGNGRSHWRTKGAGLNILYGLDELAKRPAAPVLVVEGEKAADAARLLFPDWVVVCWKGGCSNVGKIDFSPLRGRIVYLLADADEPGEAAMQTARTRVAAAGAVRITLAIPPDACWEAKKGWDLADELPNGWTVDRIRDHIVSGDTSTACGLRPYYEGPRMSSRDTRRFQAKLIREFVPEEAWRIIARETARQRAEEEMAGHEDLTPAQKSQITKRHKKEVRCEFGIDSLDKGRCVLITGSQGSGKSHDSLKALSKLNVPWLRIVFTLPTVEKCWEAAAEYNAMCRANSLPAYVVRGRGAYADKPDHNGIRISDTLMCLRAKTANWVAAMGLSPRQTLCPTCPFRDTCATLRQEEELEAFDGGVFFMAREYVFLPMPIDGVHMLIGDESLTTVAASDPTFVDPEKIMAVGNWLSTGIEAAVDAMAVLGLVHKAVTEHSGAILAALRDLKVDADSLRKTAAYLDEVREEAVKDRISGDMTDEAIESVLEEIQQLQFGSVARLCRQLVTELHQPRDQTNTVCRRQIKDKKTGERLDRVVVFHLKKAREISNKTPVLLLDGTGSVDLNRKLFGERLEHHHLPIERAAQVFSTIGRGFSRQSITGTDREDNVISDEITKAAADLRQEIVSLATELQQSVFVCSTMRAETALEPAFALSRQGGADIATAHFADVRGKNRWKHYPVALLIGREEVTPAALEDMTRPFLADDPELLVPSIDGNGRPTYVKQSRGRRMRDGTVEVVEVSVHPDPRCEAMHEQIREAELLQALDRVRAIYNQRTVYLLNDLVLDVTYDANLSWRDLKSGGTRFDVAFKRTGQTVFLDAPGEWSRCFPDLWGTKNAAKCAVKGGVRFPIVIRELPLANRPPLCITYQRPGKGQQPCRAWVYSDPAKAHSALESVVGPVLDTWSIDWAATVSMRTMPQVPAPLVGDELDDMEEETVTALEPAAVEPDEPAIREAAAAGHRVELNTEEGFEKAIQLIQSATWNGIPVLAVPSNAVLVPASRLTLCESIGTW